MSQTFHSPAAPRAISAAGLGALYVFTAVALAGFATFGLNPSLLGNHPRVIGFYAISFQFFAQAQVWLAFGVLALFLALTVGWRWIAAFACLYVISLASELTGTRTGLPFGHYSYTDALGPKWFDLVPVVIPLSWFFMALPSYALARVAFPGSATSRVILASFVLMAWDLVLDPAMSSATRYWNWAEPGVYYGMPWLNLFGWYITGLMLMLALALLQADDWIRELPVSWLAAFYGANLLLPVGMAAATGMWGAVAASLLVLGITGLTIRVLARRRGMVPSAARLPA